MNQSIASGALPLDLTTLERSTSNSNRFGLVLFLIVSAFGQFKDIPKGDEVGHPATYS